MIVSNPPYIADNDWLLYAKGLAFEPQNALISGADGLDAIRTIIAHGEGLFKAQAGYLIIEHGFDQGSCGTGIFLPFWI